MYLWGDKLNENVDVKNKKKLAIINEVIVCLKSVISAILIIFVLMLVGFGNVRVQGISMQPTLHNGDRLLIFNLNYKPSNGDIIVFKPYEGSNELYVKRIIASPGQEVDIDFKKNNVYVDGKLLVDKFSLNSIQMISDLKFPLTVPDNSYFVMGDNRDNSMDSRDSRVGFVDGNSIKGKVVMRMWPLNSIDFF